MNYLKSFLLSISILLISTAVMAQNQFVNVPALQVIPDVASSGRGFTGVASYQSPAMLLYNPATLALQSQGDVRFSRFNWLDGLADVKYNFMTAAIPIDQSSTIGFYVSYLDLGETVARDDQANELEKYSSHELSIGLSYGRVALYKKLAIGIGLRYTQSTHPPFSPKSNEKATGRAVTLDLGLMYYPGAYNIGGIKGVPTIGFSITNFGSRIEYSDSGYKDPLPTLLRLGISNKFILDPNGINILKLNVEFSKLLVRVDSTGAHAPFQALFSSWGSYDYYSQGQMKTATFFDQWMIGLGLEYWYNHLIGLRAGYYSESENNGGRKLVTFGMGVKYEWLILNGSYIVRTNDTLIDSGFRIGVGFNF